MLRTVWHLWVTLRGWSCSRRKVEVWWWPANREPALYMRQLWLENLVFCAFDNSRFSSLYFFLFWFHVLFYLRCDWSLLPFSIPDVMEYLVSEGADLQVRDSSGITPLHCSIANDNPKCCEILLTNKARINPVMRTKDVSWANFTSVLGTSCNYRLAITDLNWPLI